MYFYRIMDNSVSFPGAVICLNVVKAFSIIKQHSVSIVNQGYLAC